MEMNSIVTRMIFWKRIALMISVACMACSAHTANKAAEGAAIGAAAGAAGNMITALVFGGNVGEAAARGAVWGGTTGAVAGGISGAQQQQAAKAQQSKSIEKLKTELGEDAFNGLAALTECKHEVALAYARTAAKSNNRNYALAGKWLEILAYADSRQESRARTLFPDLISSDPKIDSESQAEEKMRSVLQKLMNIREEYNLPKTCG